MLVLGFIICFLILGSIAGSIARYQYGVTSSYAMHLFNLDSEKNFPTFFSTLLLVGCSGVLAFIAYARKRQQRKDFWYWTGLSLGFLFLGADEFIEIHEPIGTAIHTSLNTTGVFYFAWIIPYSILALAIVAAYLPFVWKLPKTVKKLMILAGFLYVGGALGMEAVASYFNYQLGERGLYFAVLTTIEESLEMFGLLVFLYALLSYINVVLGGLFVRVGLSHESLAAMIARGEKVDYYSAADRPAHARSPAEREHVIKNTK